MKDKILCVDDDPAVLTALIRSLERNYIVDTAENGQKALVRLRAAGPYAVIISDLKMPGMSGVDLLQQAAEIEPDTVRIVLTGFPDVHAVVAAVNQGRISQFLPKPFSPGSLLKTVDAGVQRYRILRSERDLLERTLNGAINVLMEILAIIDPVSFDLAHVLRDEMRQFVDGRKSGGDWIYEVAAMLSPIGNVTVPPQVLQKAWNGEALNADEQAMIDHAPAAGAEFLINIPRLETVSQIVRLQSKNFDGSGYPADAVAGKAIPKASRILKVLTDRLRLRQAGHSPLKVAEIMNLRQGWYDPEILGAVVGSSPVAGAMLAPQPTQKSIRLQDLQVGMVLAEDIRTNYDMLIVKARSKINPILLQRLHNFAQLGGLREPIRVE
jgi:response regulator RpfG family c-di-GMP phosphodiesterase